MHIKDQATSISNQTEDLSYLLNGWKELQWHGTSDQALQKAARPVDT